MLVTMAFGLNPSWGMLLVPPIAALAGFGWASCGIFIAARAKAIESFSYWQSGLLTPMFLVAGTFFPLTRLPNWAAGDPLHGTQADPLMRSAADTPGGYCSSRMMASSQRMPFASGLLALASAASNPCRFLTTWTAKSSNVARLSGASTGRARGSPFRVTPTTVLPGSVTGPEASVRSRRSPGRWRRAALPSNLPHALARHCAEEYANLGTLLPELHARFGNPASEAWERVRSSSTSPEGGIRCTQSS